MVCGCMWILEWILKTHHVFRRDWTRCSNYANHSRLNSHPHNWEDLYDHLMSTRILTFVTNKMSSKYYEAHGSGHNLELLNISH